MLPRNRRARFRPHPLVYVMGASLLAWAGIISFFYHLTTN